MAAKRRFWVFGKFAPDLRPVDEAMNWRFGVGYYDARAAVCLGVRACATDAVPKPAVGANVHAARPRIVWMKLPIKTRMRFDDVGAAFVAQDNDFRLWFVVVVVFLPPIHRKSHNPVADVRTGCAAAFLADVRVFIAG